MAHKNACHPSARPAEIVTRQERMAQLETQGQALADEYRRLEDEEDAATAIPAQDLFDSAEPDTGTGEDVKQDAAPVDAADQPTADANAAPGATVETARPVDQADQPRDNPAASVETPSPVE